MTYDRSQFIAAPWEGLNDSLPSMLLPRNGFRQVTGWLINKGRLHPFPALNVFTGPPDGEAIQGAQTFTDVLGFLHTGVITKDHVYYLNNINNYQLQGATSPGFNGLTPFTSNQPFSTLVYLNRLFYANGIGLLNYLDGGAGVNIAGDTPSSCFFLGKLAGSLLQLYPQGAPLNVQWSGINNPFEWNAAIDPTAGQVTLPEVDDQIMGYTVQKGSGVILRSAGITIMTPTGNFLPRFSFNSFSDGPNGVGENFTLTLGTYGDVAVFVGEDDIYMFSSLQAQKIAGKSKRSIFADLANSSGNPWACIIGKFTIGFDYLAYWLNIPQNNNTTTSTWIFHFDDQTWVNIQLPYNGLKWMGSLTIS